MHGGEHVRHHQRGRHALDEPRAGDEHQRERQRVTGDDQLDRCVAQAEVTLDRRQCDVHDRGVEDVHEHGDEQDGECGALSTRRRRGGSGSGERLAKMARRGRRDELTEALMW